MLNVRGRRPAFGLIGICMVIIGIRLQTCMRVLVDVDVYVRVLLEIKCSWRADYIERPLPGPGSRAAVTLKELPGCFDNLLSV